MENPDANGKPSRKGGTCLFMMSVSWDGILWATVKDGANSGGERDGWVILR